MAVVALLSRPRSDRAHGTMRYLVRPLSEASGKLTDFQAGLDPRVPRHFGAVSMFIDAATARQPSERNLGHGRWRVDL